ncbi:methyltransferase [Myceligenerans sp. TRM 65318]|uniref:Methyltransferase n=2 Tax=Myceligenerans pegani TaxID=2776917 RepID=A0ABR9MW29_9MICO|nr:methyltransferase [Myceligenerans sp. TRM 65318]MBE3017867.1 methyltransferase [Myceligenerans sp. TRM 65318]
MTHAMNEVLGALFTEVEPSLARQKSRLLVARDPVPGARERPLTYPVREVLRGVPGFPGPVTVVAHGGVFAGTELDGGTRFLLEQAGGWPSSSGPMDDDGGAGAAQDAPGAPHAEAQRSPASANGSDLGAGDGQERRAPAPALAVDLGCGSGILATALALRGFEVVATDRSAAAVASADATAAANGVGHLVRTVRDDAGASLPDACVDLVLLNPPFHDRAAVSTDAAHRMFATAGRVLRPGSQLWTVFNSALRYRPALERVVGPTRQIARDRRFTVTRSTRPA